MAVVQSNDYKKYKWLNFSIVPGKKEHSILSVAVSMGN